MKIIRQITAELLRAGPRHNQLLSPLTQYLGVCGDSQAGLVFLPYEHAEFSRLLSDLRYTVSAEKGAGRRRGVLDQIGTDMARILDSIPGLSGALNREHDGPEQVTHLRLVISAAELALLPFEVSKVPVGAGAAPDSTWLMFKAPGPVCITRRDRSVPAEGVRWPTRPRILFISGPDVPHDQHEAALRKAVKPCVGHGPVDAWLTICENATLKEVVEACARASYTHVHILAHGAEDKTAPGSFGLSLRDGVHAGKALATALNTVDDDGIHRPAVVTLATCDSGQEGGVDTPDASVAHDLHKAGIPLVVASQFPLSVAGSIPFVETFYTDQVWGAHPFISLHNVRKNLHTLYSGDYHDWASLVIYEALPRDLDTQLQTVQYHQANRAQKAALNSLETTVYDDEAVPNEEAYQRVQHALGRLPTEGPYATDCIGLRAAAHKRLAEVAYRLSKVDETAPEHYLGECHERLEQALVLYKQAVEAFLVNPEDLVHREASLHWVLCQALSVSLILGNPFDEEAWMTARMSARMEIEHSSGTAKAWGHGTMAELLMLRLADKTISDDERAGVAKEVLRHVNKVVDIAGWGSFPVKSTGRQFNRYVEWWGDRDFTKALEEFGVPPGEHWHHEDGLVSVAKRVVKALRYKQRSTKRKVAKSSKKTEKSTHEASEEPAPVQEEHAVKTSGALLGVTSAPRAPDNLIFDVNMLPARNGDCLWIEYGTQGARRRILIDCGAESAAEVLKDRIDRLPDDQRFFELFVLTHIDSDHISGVVPFFSNLSPGVAFGDVWYNGWEQLPRHLLGVRQAEVFTGLLSAQRMPWNRTVTPEGEARQPVVVTEGTPLPSFSLRDGMKLTLLSPRTEDLAQLARKWQTEGLKELAPEKAKKFLKAKPRPSPVTDFTEFKLEPLVAEPAPPDPSIPNGSSIAVLAEFEGRAALLTGDAHAEVLAASIRTLLAERGKPGGKLRVDALKLSHHGSKNALSNELLDLLDCPRYLVCSDGSYFYHPDREAIARVILHGGDKPTLYFNYRSEHNELWEHDELKQRYRYETVYPDDGEEGLLVSL